VAAIFGLDQAAVDDVITGSTTYDNVPVLRLGISAIADPIEATARIGDLIEIGICTDADDGVHGFGELSAAFQVLLTDPYPDTANITLGDVLEALDDDAVSLDQLVTFDGIETNAELMLPICVSSTIPGLTLPDMADFSLDELDANYAFDPLSGFPHIQVDFPDFFNYSDDGSGWFEFNSADLGSAFSLNNFDDFGFEGFGDLDLNSILQWLQTAIEFVDGQFGGLGIMDANIPVVNVSLGDAFDFLTEFSLALEGFDGTDSDGNTITAFDDLSTRLSAATGLAINLGLDTDALALGNTVLRIDIPYHWDLPDSPVSFPFDFDIGDIMGEEVASLVGSFVELEGGGGLDVDLSVDMNLALGLDLNGNDDGDGGFTLRPFLYAGEPDGGADDPTHFSIGLNIAGNDIAFSAYVGPYGIEIGNEANPVRVVLDNDGLNADGLGSDSEDDAVFSIYLDETPDGGGAIDGDEDGRLYLMSDIADSGPITNVFDALTVDLDGYLSVEVPSFLSSGATFCDTIDFDLNLEGFIDSEVGFGDIASQIGSVSCDTSGLFTGFDLGSGGMDSLLAALDMFLGLVEDGLDGEVAGFKLPFMKDGSSDKFEEAAAFIRVLRDDAIQPIRDAIAADPDRSVFFEMRDTLFTFINGLGWLADQDADGLVTVDDILVFAWDDAIPSVSTQVTDTNDDGSLSDEAALTDASAVSLRFNLAKDFATFTTDLDSDIGIPGLGLTTDGTLSGGFDFQTVFEVGVHDENGAFFVLPEAVDVALGVSLDLVDLQAEGNLAFLQLDLDTMEAGDPNLSDAERTTGTGQLIDTINGFSGSIGLSLGDGSTPYYLKDIGDLFETTGFAIEAEGSLHLDALASLEGNANFPSIGTEIHLLWHFDNVEPGNELQMPDLAFTDVQLNLGEFLTDFLGPMIEKIQSVIEPVQPLIDALTAPLPLISDLSGQDVSLADLAGFFGYSEIESFIEAVDQIADFSSTISALSGEELFIDLGGFSIQKDADGNLDFDSGPQEDAVATSYDRSTAMPTGSAGNLVNNASDADAAATTDCGEPNYGFAFPLLDDPLQAFQLLMGKEDLVLVTYDMPPLEIEFSYSQYFPIIGPLGARIGGSIGAMVDLAFGYDTQGFFDFAATDYTNFGKIFNGLYVSDTCDPTGESGTDVPEIVLTGELSAFGEINVAVARGGVGGGITATVDLNLNDPNDDGKVRISELVQNALLPSALPGLFIFDVSGKVEAFLEAYIEVGWCPLCVEGSWELARIELLSFELDRPEPEAEEGTLFLGTMDGDTLQLNIGPRAGDRNDTLPAGDDNNDDVITLTRGSDDNTIFVYGFGLEEPQLFENVSQISIDSGGGNDAIAIDDDITLPVSLVGGDGNDTLSAGDGPTTIEGGDGDDVLTGGIGDDSILGGEGNDDIDGQSGDDVLVGGIGADTVDGESGDDLIYGDDSDDGDGDGAGAADLISGGTGDDSIHGQDGNDSISGGDGYDEIYGGDDDDQITGGENQDYIDGGSGNDSISGGNSNDVLLGSTGDDLIEAGSGADQADGGDGNDSLYGNSGDDTLAGNNGNDLIVAGSSLTPGEAEAYHTLSGGDGNDSIYGDLGNDLIDAGDGDNLVVTFSGNDQVNAGSGDDTINTGSGDDVIDAGDGDNSIHGGTGNETITAGSGNDWIDARNNEDADPAAGTASEITTHIITAGAGDNVIYTDNGVDSINSGSGDDIIYAYDADDVIDSGSGDDLVIASGGHNVIETGDGNDSIQTGDGNDSISSGAGDDQVVTAGGDDTVSTSSGDDNVNSGSGNDSLFVSSGNDIVSAGSGDDLVVGGDGDDYIDGGAGNDVLWGGAETYSHSYFDLDDSLLFTFPPGYEDAEEATPTGFDVAAGLPWMTPVVLAGLSIDGSPDDGQDTLIAGDGDDFAFGGGQNDSIEAGSGQDYVDGGVGSEDLDGGDGNDIVRGGGNDDTVKGGAGIDQLYGDDGRDVLFSGSGDDSGNQLGQRLYGGSDSDYLYAYAELIDDDFEDPSQIPFGDQLFGDSGNDYLYGNLRRDALDGGNGNDYLHGDRLSGPTYRDGTSMDTAGGPDTLRGGSGEDLLYGGGGDDLIFGGGDSDDMTGQDGRDILLGGAGIDLMRMDTDVSYSDFGEIIDGHYGNHLRNDVDDDNATDILVIAGSDDDDFIEVAEIDVAVESGDLAIVAETPGQAVPGKDGQLSGTATFTITLGAIDYTISLPDTEPAPAAVDPITTYDNTSLADLATDINRALNDLMVAARPPADQVTLIEDYQSGDLDPFDYNGDAVLWANPVGNRIRIQTVDQGQDAFLQITNVNDIARDELLLDEGAVGVGLLTVDIAQYEDAVFTSHHYFVGWRDEDGTPLVEQIQISGLNGDDLLGFASGERAPDVSQLSERSNDWVGVINGGYGDDYLVGTNARDRLDGGYGSDVIYGHGDDDRLWGDTFSGNPGDLDVLFGGSGNDDLIGGQGRNRLYAWSADPLGSLHLDANLELGPGETLAGFAPLHPKGAIDRTTRLMVSVDGAEPAEFVLDARVYGGPSDIAAALNTLFTAKASEEGFEELGYLSAAALNMATDDKLELTLHEDATSTLSITTDQFGIYVDSQADRHDNDGDLDDNGTLDTDDTQVPRDLEDTGLNRMLGMSQNDSLYGGTGLDFLYGNGGDDLIYTRDGELFQDAYYAGVSDDAWKAYAQSTDAVWYYSASNADDVIHVDYVTEPGLLSDHHLITRLTDAGDGFFTFAAQVKLDFDATDDDGNLIWDSTDRVVDLESTANLDGDERTLAYKELELNGALLPGEGDFLAIIIDALDGNDEVYIGPTVQKTVWIDAGAGDDRVEIQSGNALLVDHTEANSRNEVADTADDPSKAWALYGPTRLVADTEIIADGQLSDRARFDISAGISNATHTVELEIDSLADSFNYADVVDGLNQALADSGLDDLLTVATVYVDFDGVPATPDEPTLALVSSSDLTITLLDSSSTLANLFGIPAGSIVSPAGTLTGTIAGPAEANLATTLDGDLWLELSIPETALAGRVAIEDTPDDVDHLVTLIQAGIDALGEDGLIEVQKVAADGGGWYLAFAAPDHADEIQLEITSSNSIAQNELGLAPGLATDSSAIAASVGFTNLTLDNPKDVDWYTFQLAAAPQAGTTISVQAHSSRPELQLALFAKDVEGDWAQVTIDPTDETAGTNQASLDLIDDHGDPLVAGTTYAVQVTSLNLIPAQYDLRLDLGDGSTTDYNMSLSEDVVRKDVILGGDGHDILIGGPAEDWIFGEGGNDVISGGLDQQAPDLLFGQDGDDIFQIITDDLPVDPTTGESLLTTQWDTFNGGDGYDRAMFVGGDYDRLSRPVDDHVAIRFNRFLQRYELTTLVWDIANQEFMTEGGPATLVTSETTEIDIETGESAAEQVVDAFPSNGRLTDSDGELVDATFTLTVSIEGVDPVTGEVTLSANVMDDNNTPDDLVDDLNDAIQAAGLGDWVVADIDSDELAFDTVATGTTVTLSLEFSTDNGAARLGFLASTDIVETGGSATLLNATGNDSVYKQRYAAYQVFDTEATVIDTRAGDDVVHADPEYKFPLPGGGVIDSEWGIKAGNFQEGADIASLQILGGDGNDRLFGGFRSDRIEGGDGADFIAGDNGSDTILGGPGRDLIFGNGTGRISPDNYEAGTHVQGSGFNDSLVYASLLSEFSIANLPEAEIEDGDPTWLVVEPNLTFNLGDAGDWYVIPVPQALKAMGDFDNSTLTSNAFRAVFDNDQAAQLVFDGYVLDTDSPAGVDDKDQPQWASNLYLYAAEDSDPQAELALIPVEQPTGVPDYYLLHVLNPLSFGMLALDDVDTDSLPVTPSATTVKFDITVNGATTTDVTATFDTTCPLGDPEVLVASSVSSVACELNVALAAAGLQPAEGVKVIAYQAPASNRLALTLTEPGDLTISFDAAAYPEVVALGFENTQANNAPAAELGTYSLQIRQDVGNTIDVDAMDAQLHLSDTSDVTTSALIPLGDLNGDGFADFVFAVQDDFDLNGIDAGLAAGFSNHPHEYRGSSTALIHLSNADADDPLANATTVQLTLPAPVLKSSNGVRSVFAPPADYNGDGIDDLAVLVTRGIGHSVGLDTIYYPNTGVYILEGGTNWSEVTQRDLVLESDARIDRLVNPRSLANGNLMENDQDDITPDVFVTDLDELVIGQDNLGDGSVASVFVVATPTGQVWTEASGVYFQTDLESETSELTPVSGTEGLWHLSQGRGDDFFHSGDTSFYYGTGESASTNGNFNVGRTTGILRSSNIQITESVQDLTLGFQYFLQTESSTNWDKAQVHVLINGVAPGGQPIQADRTGSKTATLDQTNDPNRWKQATISLGPVNGTPETPVTISFDFVFDTGDAILNSFEGWYIDDVILYAASDAHDISQTVYTGDVSQVVTADLDDDGFTDLAVMPSDSLFANGHLYVVSGPLTAIAGLPDITLADHHSQNIVLPAFESARLDNAGSLNGDGAQELLISMVQLEEPSETSVIVWGSAGASIVADTSPHDEAVGLLVPLGDIDGDGDAELAVAAMEETAAVDPTGDSTWHSVFQVLLGGTDRWLDPTLMLKQPDLIVEPGRPVYLDNGDTPDSTRARIAALGDVNGDGTYGDFGVADFLADTSHVIYGGAYGDAVARDDGSLEPEDFRFEPTTPQLDVVQPREGLDLNRPLDEQDAYDIRRAYRVEGDADDEQLSSFEPIGDFNRDGYQDFMAVGTDTAYILLGPVHLDDIHNVRERAEIIIDLEGLGTPQTSGSGDINSDSYDDILFVTHSKPPGGQTQTLSLSVIPGAAYPERFLDQSHATVVRTIGSPLASIDSLQVDFVRSTVNNDWVHVLADGDIEADGGGGGLIPSVLGFVFKQVDLGTTFDLVADGQSDTGDTDSANLILNTPRGAPGAELAGFVIADVNANGEDDLVYALNKFSESGSILSSQVVAIDPWLTIVQGKKSTLAIDPDGSQYMVGNTAKAFTSLHVLGDLNRDAYDDIAIGMESATGSEADVLVFYSQGTETGFTLSDADLRLQLFDPRFLNSQAVHSASFDLTGGDFDNDGATDLAVTQSDIRLRIPDEQGLLHDVTAIRRGRMHVIWNPASLDSSIILSETATDLDGDGLQDVVMVAAAMDNDGFNPLPESTSIDLDHDGYDDLVVAAPQADALSDSLLEQAGGLYLISGTPRRTALPDGNEVDIRGLNNLQFTGAGDAIVDTATGRPYTATFDRDLDGVVSYDETFPSEYFDNDDYILEADEQDRWYRFTLVGDGQPGDMIRVLPAAYNDPEFTINGTGATIDAAGVVTDGGSIHVGGLSPKLAALEFDLVALTEAVHAPEALDQVMLTLQGTVNPLWFHDAEQLVAGSGQMFFVADHVDTGRELWVSNGQSGKPEDTHLVVDLISGTTGSDPQSLVTDDTNVFFSIVNNSGDRVAYVSNGTQTGTRQLLGTVSAPVDVDNLTLNASDLYFTGTDRTGADQLYVARKGTDYKLEQLTLFDVSKGLSIETLTLAGDFVYLATRLTSTPAESILISWDLVNAVETELGIFDDDPTKQDTDDLLRQSADVHGTLVFAGRNKAAAGVGNELWGSNGNSVWLIDDIRGGSADSGPTAFAVDNGRLHFLATTNSSGQLRMLSTDGTVGSIRDGGAILASVAADPIDLDHFQGLVVDSNYFVAVDDHSGSTSALKLFSSNDGTPAEILAVNPYAGGRLDALTEVDGHLAFHVRQFNGTSTTSEIYISDGTAARTRSLNEGNAFSSPATSLAAFGSDLFFLGPQRFTSGDDVWYADTTEQTVEVLVGREPIPGTLNVSLRDDEGNGLITGLDFTAKASLVAPTANGTDNLNTALDTQIIQIDITEGIRKAIRNGHHQITLRLESDDLDISLEPIAIDTAAALTVTWRHGVRADIIDANGGVIEQGIAGIDIREVPAGDYYLRVFNPHTDSQTQPLGFTVEVMAPIQGEYDSPQDQDLLRGGENADILVGNEHIDRLYGDSGHDVFVAEDVEPRDIQDNELRLTVENDERLISTTYVDQDQPLAPDFDNLRDCTAPVVSSAHASMYCIPDPSLQLWVADQLDIPFVTSVFADKIFDIPVRPTDMSKLWMADLSSWNKEESVRSGVLLEDLTGLEYATNLSRSTWPRHPICSRSKHSLPPESGTPTSIRPDSPSSDD